MKKIILILGLLLLPNLLYAGAPSRTKTYTTGAIILPADVTENEDNIYRYLQTGVDTYADGTIVSADITNGTIVNADISSSAAITYGKLSFSNNIVAGDIATSAVDSAEINDNSIVNADINSSAAIAASKLSLGGVVLPSGALFYMITGSCPAGTTDVTATYSNKFVRINTTGGSTGGADTDSITLVTANMPVHNHTVGIWGQGNVADTGNITGQATTNETAEATSSTGSGTAFTVDTVPAFVTAKACQVN